MPIHVKANPGDVAPYVLLPGDPNRATYVAEHFLEAPVRYTDYRCMYGYTGHYKGVRVSVQTTGMGCPSTAIVVEELAMLGAKVLIRIGTTGAIVPMLKPSDVVIAQAALPNDGTSRMYMGNDPHMPLPSYRVLQASVETAKELGLQYHTGTISSEDSFYAYKNLDDLRLRGVLSIEMEASALFTVARLRNMEAGCLLAVSNQVGDTEHVPDETLKRGVDDMVRLALETIVKLDAEKKL